MERWSPTAPKRWSAPQTARLTVTQLTTQTIRTSRIGWSNLTSCAWAIIKLDLLGVHFLSVGQFSHLFRHRSLIDLAAKKWYLHRTLPSSWSRTRSWWVLHWTWRFTLCFFVGAACQDWWTLASCMQMNSCPNDNRLSSISFTRLLTLSLTELRLWSTG